MKYILATFSSRNETLAFARILKSCGLATDIINTPSSIMDGGCSISVRFPQNSLALAQRMLKESKFYSFRGFFLLFFQNGRQIAQKI